MLTAVGLLFRRFGQVAREGNSVERVYDFARRVEEVSPDEAGTLQIVQAVRELLNAERVALWLPPYLDEEPRLVVAAENGAVWYDGPGDPDDVFRRRAVATADGPLLVSLARADDEEAAALARRGVSDLLGAPVMTAAGEPGYLEVCDRRSDIVSFADSDRAALESMLTHVNAAIRHQQLLTQIRYDADHDRLTGLPNRQRLAAEIDAAARRRPGRRPGRAHPGRAGQLHRGHRHPRARGQRRAAARHRRAAARARAPAGARWRAWRASSSPSCCPACPWPPPSAPPAACGRRPRPAPASPGWTSRSR